MWTSRISSAAECSTSYRNQAVPGAQRCVGNAAKRGRCMRSVRYALSSEDDRPGEQTYQTTHIPDSLPVAESGSDWREFRARLVASSKSTGSSAPKSPAGVGTGFNQLEWAHELSRPEAGCLLLAHPYMFRERQTYFYQAVILLLDHGPEGSYGIILNRPTQYKVSQIKSSVHSLLSLFPENRLFMGGDCGDTAMVVLTHRSDIEGATAVTDGVYHYNVHGAHAAVASGQAQPSDFRFYAQYAGWAPGQLEMECKSGVWFCTAASPALTLNAELSNGRAMWHAILQVMGGDHARVSDIVNEVERRDLRDATARLLQEANSDMPSPAAEADEQQQFVDEESSCFNDDQLAQ